MPLVSNIASLTPNDPPALPVPHKQKALTKTVANPLHFLHREFKEAAERSGYWEGAEAGFDEGRGTVRRVCLCAELEVEGVDW